MSISYKEQFEQFQKFQQQQFEQLQSFQEMQMKNWGKDTKSTEKSNTQNVPQQRINFVNTQIPQVQYRKQQTPNRKLVNPVKVNEHRPIYPQNLPQTRTNVPNNMGFLDLIMNSIQKAGEKKVEHQKPAPVSHKRNNVPEPKRTCYFVPKVAEKKKPAAPAPVPVNNFVPQNNIGAKKSVPEATKPKETPKVQQKQPLSTLEKLEQIDRKYEEIISQDKSSKVIEAELMQLILQLDDISCSAVLRPARKALASKITQKIDEIISFNAVPKEIQDESEPENTEPEYTEPENTESENSESDGESDNLDMSFFDDSLQFFDIQTGESYQEIEGELNSGDSEVSNPEPSNDSVNENSSAPLSEESASNTVKQEENLTENLTANLDKSSANGEQSTPTNENETPGDTTSSNADNNATPTGDDTTVQNDDNTTPTGDITTKTGDDSPASNVDDNSTPTGDETTALNGDKATDNSNTEINENTEAASLPVQNEANEESNNFENLQNSQENQEDFVIIEDCDEEE